MPGGLLDVPARVTRSAASGDGLYDSEAPGDDVGELLFGKRVVEKTRIESRRLRLAVCEEEVVTLIRKMDPRDQFNGETKFRIVPVLLYSVIPWPDGTAAWRDRLRKSGCEWLKSSAEPAEASWE
ncbi:MAG: hypothetical protein ACYTKD_24960 [Planctomycetota bacterium]